MGQNKRKGGAQPAAGRGLSAGEQPRAGTAEAEPSRDAARNRPSFAPVTSPLLWSCCGCSPRIQPGPMRKSKMSHPDRSLQLLTAPMSSLCSFPALTNKCSERSPGRPCPDPAPSQRRAGRHGRHCCRNPWARRARAWPFAEERYRKRTPIRDAGIRLGRPLRCWEGLCLPPPTNDKRRLLQTAGYGLGSSNMRSGRCFRTPWPGPALACLGAAGSREPGPVARSPRGPTCAKQSCSVRAGTWWGGGTRRRGRGAAIAAWRGRIVELSASWVGQSAQRPVRPAQLWHATKPLTRPTGTQSSGPQLRGGNCCPRAYSTAPKAMVHSVASANDLPDTRAAAETMRRLRRLHWMQAGSRAQRPTRRACAVRFPAPESRRLD